MAELDPLRQPVTGQSLAAHRPFGGKKNIPWHCVPRQHVTQPNGSSASSREISVGSSVHPPAPLCLASLALPRHDEAPHRSPSSEGRKNKTPLLEPGSRYASPTIGPGRRNPARVISSSLHTPPPVASARAMAHLVIPEPLRGQNEKTTSPKHRALVVQKCHTHCGRGCFLCAEGLD
jgi:hypothetical protein